MKRYLTAAIEQGLWSLLQLGVNLLLLRLIAPDQYGAFAFWSNCAFVLASLQSALTVTHILVLPPGAADDEARLATERLMLAVSLVFWVVVGVATGAAVLVAREEGSVLAAPAAALFLPAFLLQQYLRLLTFSRGNPLAAAIQTGAVLVLSLVLITAAAMTQDLTANGVLLLMAAAYGSVGAIGLALAVREQLAGLRPSVLRGYVAYLRASGWIFLGVGSSEVLTRFYAFAVAAIHGPAALAALSATQLLLRPIPLLATSWSMVARGDLARAREAGDAARFARPIVLALVGGAVVATVWSVAVTGGWPLIAHYLYGGKYADVGWMTPLWGIAAGLSFGQTAVSIGLQMLKAYRTLALTNAAAAVVAVAALVLLMRAYGPGGAIVGTAVGQGLELVVMGVALVLLLRGMRRA